MFSCDICAKSFARKFALKRHITDVHQQGGKVQCETCCKLFRKDNYQMHVKFGCLSTSKKRAASSSSSKADPAPKKLKPSVEASKTRKCDICDAEVDKSKWPGHLRSMLHRDNCQEAVISDRVKKVKSGFNNRLATYRITSSKDNLHVIKDYIMDLKPDVEMVMNEICLKYINFKFNIELFALYTKPVNPEVKEMKSFNTKNEIFCSQAVAESSFDELYDKFRDVIATKSEEFQESGSGWALEKIAYLEVNFAKYAPIKGGSYLPLPKWILAKRAVLNVKNKDDFCFVWALVAARYPQQSHSDRTSSYPDYQMLDLKLDGIEFPMALKSIEKFEKMNPTYSITVFGISTSKTIIGPLYFTRQPRAEYKIDLLIIQQGVTTHYCWIKDLSRLVSKQITRRQHKKFICRGCLIHFRTEDELKRHQENDCNHVYSILPSGERGLVKFDKYKKCLKVPFVVYADFEAILKKLPPSGIEHDPDESYTETIAEHIPCSFAFKVKCSFDDTLDNYRMYRGADCVKTFWEYLVEEAERITQHWDCKPMLPLSGEEWTAFNNATICHVCDQVMAAGDKVRDHDHYTGRFRGAAHTNCNMQMQRSEFIPVILHNLSNYDAHFIIQGIGYDNEKIKVIPNTKERYISFSKNIMTSAGGSLEVRFLDSYRFMASSLDKLASHLEPEQMVNLKACFPDEFQLMCKKGVFPYEYLDDWEKLQQQTELPPIEQFHSKLTGKGISEEEYARAQQIWKKFQCRNLGEYSDLYLQTDVLLLCDVFENFRTTCLQTYKLDPAQYFTAPGLSWDAMLRHTKITLQLLTDIDMLHFVQKAIRGGLVQCVKRKAVANNKYLDTFDESKPSNYLLYLDANNLYGAAMSQYLPYGGFEWVDDCDQLNVQDVSDNSDIGYILEVDLKYPPKLHDRHRDLPFCPENIIPPTSKSKHSKLIANVMNKSNYIIHYRNLKQCLTNGLVLSKIHRALRFKQSPWLRSYIDLNTAKRIAARNEFDKDFYKLMNNAVFGKTMENVQKRVDVKLLTHWEDIKQKRGAQYYINLPQFHSFGTFGENLTAVQLNRTKVYFDKPIYVGFAILDVSKIVMYDFHYSYIKQKFGDDAELMYMDTDSLFYDIKTADVYEDIKPDLVEWFDTSAYAPNNFQNYPNVNSQLVGKFKDEFKGKLVSSYIGLKAKSYCISVARDRNPIVIKNKGAPKSANIAIDDFRDALDNSKTIRKTIYVFNSCNHIIHTQMQHKIVLSDKDDKRYVIPGSVQTLPWGHKDVV